MGLSLPILYRGPLSSCNYDCWYCPFAKHHETATELNDDRQKLERFVEWVAKRDDSDQISIFFTPWGEALTRRTDKSIMRTGLARRLSKGSYWPVVYLSSFAIFSCQVYAAMPNAGSKGRALQRGNRWSQGKL